MNNYTKLFSHIITSSIWDEDDQTRILWITLLALSDKYGEVMASVPGLANVSRLPIESVKRGIGKLSSPDEHSRTPDEEGRRIVKIDGGWEIINYELHRRMASLDERREKSAERMRRYRKRRKEEGSPVTQSVTQCRGSVTQRYGSVTHQTDNADADAEYPPPSPSLKIKEGNSDNGESNPDFLESIRKLRPDVDLDAVMRDIKLWKLIPRNKDRKITKRFVINWVKKIDCEVAMPPGDKGWHGEAKSWQQINMEENYQ